MALVLADRVWDTTTTVGLADIVLSGTAPVGFQNFSIIGNGNTTYYTITGGAQWEVGIGTYSSTGPTLARTTVLASSAGGTTKVSFAVGTKAVFVTYPAERAINSDTLGAPAGSSLVGFLQGGTGAVARTSQDKMRDVVNVKDFGATGNGVTNDTAAIQAAITYVASFPDTRRPAIVFNAGVFLVSPGVFSGGPNRRGINFIGAGRDDTLIQAVSAGYFYDNGATPIADRDFYQSMRFVGIGASVADRALAGGFKLTDSTGREKRFQFLSCTFEYLNIVLETAGTTNADECTFLMCEFRECNTWLRMNNAQSMLHNAVSCRGEFRRDIIVVEAAGGGEVHWIGGSIIHYPNEGADYYWLKGNNNPAVSHQTGQFTFSRFRAELRSANSKLVSWLNSTSIAATRHVSITFDTVNLATTSQSTGTLRTNAVAIGAAKTVRFLNCVLPPARIPGGADNYEFVVDANNGETTVGNPGTIIFDTCTVHATLQNDCKVLNTYGRIINRNAIGNGQVVNVNEDLKALNFDMGWNNSVGYSTSTQPNIAQLRRNLWPTTTANETVVTLPYGAVVTRIAIYKPAQGTSSTPSTFVVGSDDKLTTYLATASARADAVHQAEITGIAANIGGPLTAANNKFRLWATGNLLAQVGGYAVIEYIGGAVIPP